MVQCAIGFKAKDAPFPSPGQIQKHIMLLMFCNFGRQGPGLSARFVLVTSQVKWKKLPVSPCLLSLLDDVTYSWSWKGNFDFTRYSLREQVYELKVNKREMFFKRSMGNSMCSRDWYLDNCLLNVYYFLNCNAMQRHGCVNAGMRYFLLHCILSR